MTLKVLQIGISSCKIIEIQSKSFTQKTFNIFKGVQNVKNAIGKKVKMTVMEFLMKISFNGAI